MIVCSCWGVNDATVEQAIVGGASTIDDVGATCQAGSDCCSCHGTIEAMLEALASADLARASAA